jgi:hypothetical protein
LVALVLVMSVVPVVGVAAGSGFTDTDGSVFEADIDWLAAEGITKGCNPPKNDKFCPDGEVTRGQMAAFLVRALKLPAASEDHFDDDTASIFEDDINRLAEAGITKGCNPPDNTSYCPNGKVTRGQMAAFLGRAYDLPSTTIHPFNDTATTIFKADIDRLAAAGITKGCNPPTNNMYCPSGLVTRGQMAAFLHRAADPVPPPGGDTTKPVIVLLGADVVSVLLDSAYVDRSATAMDNVDGDISGKIVTVNNVDTSKLGVYTVTYDVTDAAGNKANRVTRTVNVTDVPPSPDTEKPVITVVGGTRTTVAIGSGYTDRGATATDDVDGNISDLIVTVGLPISTATAGKYTVTYDVMDTAGNPADQQTRTVYVVPLESATQSNHFLTGYAGLGSLVNPLTVRSVDPAGITYGPSGHLFIVDSEINEPNLAEVWTDVGGKNVFEVSPDGSTLYGSYSLPGVSREQQEPTGIAYYADGADDVFYVTNDVTKTLYRYVFDAGAFTMDDSVSTSAAGYPNIEGVTVDASGNIYVMAEGKKTILVYTYSGGFTLDKTMDLAALNPSAPPPRTPEGIAFDAASGHLFVVSQFDSPNAIFEYTTAGVFVGITSIKDFSPKPAFGTPQHDLTAPEAPQGIAFGPGSSPAFYLADGGVDNGTGAADKPTDERDGVIYEGRLP